MLAIEEGPGMKGAAYSIRNIQSSGKITIAAAGKAAGDEGLKTKKIHGQRTGSGHAHDHGNHPG